jgi:penicillin-binding protein-related factor A (putative recombinase)
MKWHNILTTLKHQHLEATAPGFYKASGGKGMKLKPYTDTTTNGLTNAICDFLKFNKHYSNRINCIGLNRLINGKMTYTPSATRKGTADITAIINGKHVSIEVKCKATKDRMSEHQIKERQLVEASGGIYFVATDMESFLNWYYSTFFNK